MIKRSEPSIARTSAACVLYVAGGLTAFVWKVLRRGSDFEMSPALHWLIGAMPNLLPAAVLPALIFIRPQPVRFKEYISMVLVMLLVLIVYEFVQIWMPSRTFDLEDILASILGSGIGCLFCWLVFFQWLGKRRVATIDSGN